MMKASDKEVKVGDTVCNFYGEPCGKVIAINKTVKVNYGPSMREFDMGAYGIKRYPVNRIVIMQDEIEMR